MSNDRVAIVTGAGSGMGAASAESLAAAGFDLMLAGRRVEPLEAVRDRIGAAGLDSRVEIRSTDVAVPEECDALVEETVERLGRVDAAVTAAATFEPVHTFEMDAAAWDVCLDILLRGSLLVGVAAARQMRDQGDGGRIILFSSVNGTGSEPETAHYSAAKAAIISLARSMAVDFAKDHISVNAISPGWVDTPMIADFVAEATEEDFARVNPLARLGRPEEIASVVTYLAAEAPEFLTGSTLAVDGGQTAIAPVP